MPTLRQFLEDDLLFFCLARWESEDRWPYRYDDIDELSFEEFSVRKAFCGRMSPFPKVFQPCKSTACISVILLLMHDSYWLPEAAVLTAAGTPQELLDLSTSQRCLVTSPCFGLFLGGRLGVGSYFSSF